MKEKNTKPENEIVENASSEGVEAVRKKLYAHPAFIICSLVLAVAAIFFGMVAIYTKTEGVTFGEFFGITPKRLDYKKDPLDSYINIEEEDYKGYEIKLDVLKPTYEIDVESHIMNLIYKNVNTKEDFLNDAKYQYNKPILVSDKLYFYYSGYELDENGVRKNIDSLTNYANVDDAGYYYENKNPEILYVGQNKSTFPIGFELALVDKVTVKKESGKEIENTFSAKFSGSVFEGDVVYACLSYVDEYGIFHDEENVRIDLRDENVEAEWGEGIYEFLSEYYIGRTGQISGYEYLETAKGSRFYTYIRIGYTTQCETPENITTIKVVYPHDWSDESLRGKTVYFDLLLEKTVNYKTAEFNDAFVTDVLKIKAEELSEYNGANLAEKYKEYYYSTLMEEYEEICETRAQELLWDKLRDNIEFVSLPEQEYRAAYSIRYNYYKHEYEEILKTDDQYYKELDDFIAESFGVETTQAGDALRAYVKDSIYEKLIVFSVLRNEDLLPKTDAEYEKIYQNELQLDYEYYLNACEKAGEKPEYDSVEKYQAFITDYYGEEEYENIVYYNYATSQMLKMITIVY